MHLSQVMECGCLVTWFCYQLIAKPSNKTATVLWPGPHVCVWKNCLQKFAILICLSNSLRMLTHWGQVTHICVSKRTIIGSDNGLLPDRRQAIVWTNAGKVSIGLLQTNFSGILIEYHTFSFKKMHLKMLSRKWQPFCLGLNVLCCWSISRPSCKTMISCRLYCIPMAFMQHMAI